MMRNAVVLGLVLSIFGLANDRVADAGVKPAAGYISVEAKGVLKTGIVAIGGETTGVLLATGAGTLELDLKKDPVLEQMAEKLNGKTVIVTGSLTIRAGVEVRQRIILTVKSLKEAN